MPNSKLKLIEDVEFIFAEAVRFKELEKQWFETRQCPEELRQAALRDIDFPGEPHRKLTVGKAGIQRLDQLAQLAARRAGIQEQVQSSTVRKPLGESLVRRFVIEERPVDLQHIERALSEAARKAAAKRRTATHFVPCHLMLAQEPPSFGLGPVVFLRKSSFRSELAKELWANRHVENFKGRYVRDTIKYYSTFGWIARVTVPNCDLETSENLALEAVTAALNCLHLIFGPGHTYKMTVGGPAITQDRRGGVSIVDGDLRFSASYGGPGSVGFKDDWITLLDNPEGRGVMELCGVALEAAVDPTINRPLSDRFLDAAHWFGEAVRERAPAAKVIKYVTALERMFMTDERDNIADTVSQRVATFCFDPSVPGDFERLEAKSRKAYDLRSKLAHGSMSPRDTAAYEGVRLGAELSKDALLNGLAAFTAEGLREEGISPKSIAQWFQSSVEHFARIREQFGASMQP
jgi:hypothetical protein